MKRGVVSYWIATTSTSISSVIRLFPLAMIASKAALIKFNLIFKKSILNLIYPIYFMVKFIKLFDVQSCFSSNSKRINRSEAIYIFVHETELISLPPTGGQGNCIWTVHIRLDPIFYGPACSNQRSIMQLR